MSYYLIINLRRLLDKKERVDAILATLDDETQKDEIQQTITPPEQEQIVKVKKTIAMYVLSRGVC